MSIIEKNNNAKVEKNKINFNEIKNKGKWSKIIWKSNSIEITEKFLKFGHSSGVSFLSKVVIKYLLGFFNFHFFYFDMNNIILTVKTYVQTLIYFVKLFLTLMHKLYHSRSMTCYYFSFLFLFVDNTYFSENWKIYSRLKKNEIRDAKKYFS